MTKKKTNPYVSKCLHCEHSWIKRIESRPKQCPKCKRTNWDRPAMKRSKRARIAAAARWAKK